MEGKQIRYLDNVVELLVGDTIIDYNNDDVIEYSFTSIGLKSTSLSLFLDHVLSFPYFSKYIRNVYGLIGQEIEYVWKKYKTIILDKGEKIHRERYLNKVVEFIIRDVIVEIDSSRIYFYLPHQRESFFSTPYPYTYPTVLSIPIYFVKYIKDMYELSNFEKNYVWGEFINKVDIKIVKTFVKDKKQKMSNDLF